jgi:hypothetical protein
MSGGVGAYLLPSPNQEINFARLLLRLSAIEIFGQEFVLRKGSQGDRLPLEKIRNAKVSQFSFLDGNFTTFRIGFIDGDC